MASTLIKLTPIALAILLTGCGTVGNLVREFDDPVATKPQLKEEAKLKEPASGTIAVAVYSFRDMTGQRKASQNIASLSSAVTQGADAYLVKSLQEVGGGRWFKVLERGGLDNLVKERQLIRQMRELYQGKDAQPLPPMLFAGMILEGGIIGYDSNTMSGGSGARLLGIGASTEYRQDEVTISLRAVSVATGEVLVAVNISKTVYSFMDKAGILRFIESGTRSIELETGSATNESMNKAVQLAIHAAVIELIQEGAQKGHWAFKSEKQAETKKESVPKVEEKKDELVQKNTAPATAAKAEASPPEPSKPASNGGSQANIAVANTTPREEITVTSIGKSNVRSSNHSGAEIIAVLEPGQSAKVLEEVHELYLVELPSGKKGFVAKHTVKKQ
jgi:curli production assembly/transport component CsgG